MGLVSNGFRRVTKWTLGWNRCIELRTIWKWTYGKLVHTITTYKIRASRGVAVLKPNINSFSRLISDPCSVFEREISKRPKSQWRNNGASLQGKLSLFHSRVVDAKISDLLRYSKNVFNSKNCFLLLLKATEARKLASSLMMIAASLKKQNQESTHFQIRLCLTDVMDDGVGGSCSHPLCSTSPNKTHLLHGC